MSIGLINERTEKGGVLTILTCADNSSLSVLLFDWLVAKDTIKKLSKMSKSCHKLRKKLCANGDTTVYSTVNPLK